MCATSGHIFYAEIQLRDFFGVVLRFLEEDHEEKGYHEGVAGKYVPCGTPVRLGRVIYEVVHYSLRAEGSDCGTDAVGHEHEETLGTVLDLLSGPHVHVEGA